MIWWFLFILYMVHIILKLWFELAIEFVPQCQLRLYVTRRKGRQEYSLSRREPCIDLNYKRYYRLTSNSNSTNNYKRYYLLTSKQITDKTHVSLKKYDR